MFNWAGSLFHNVYIHPSGDCNETGAILVGTETGASYTFTEANIGAMEFVCDVGSHCERGMRITITVVGDATPVLQPVVPVLPPDYFLQPMFLPAPALPTPAPVTSAPVTPVTAAPITAAPITAAPITAAPTTPAPVNPAPTHDTIQIDWFIPAGDSLRPRTVNVGDTIVFNWAGFHNVYIHPTGDCNETGAILVGTETGASYTFTEANVGDMEFVCDVGSHCEFGMRVTITVFVANATAAPVAATPAPISRPTARPMSIRSPIPPSPGFPPCNVCGDGLEVTLPLVILDIPFFGELRCGRFQDVGVQGFIEAQLCPLAVNFTEPCGCSPISPTSEPIAIQTPSPTPRPTARPTLMGVPIAPIPPSPGFPPCSVCGDGLEVTLPDAIVMLPTYHPATCGHVQLAGLLGFVETELCPLITPLLADCGCATIAQPSFPAPGVSRTIEMQWFVPSLDSFPPITVHVGDTIVFIWAGSGNHNVYIHPTGDCNNDGAHLVGLDSGASYIFTEADVGEMEFVCDVDDHCELGMRVTITVQNGATSGSNSPSVASGGVL